MKADERVLLRRCLDGAKLRDAAAGTAVPRKRVLYFASKWSRKYGYSWGVSPDLGWFDDAARKAAESALAPCAERDASLDEVAGALAERLVRDRRRMMNLGFSPKGARA